jgi:hypothetical protein
MTPYQLKKITIWSSLATSRIKVFGLQWLFSNPRRWPSFHCRVISKHQDLSPVTMFLRSQDHCPPYQLNLDMQQLGPPPVLQSMHAVQSISKLFYFRSSTIIFHTVFLLISSSYANVWSKRQRFYSNSRQTFSMLPSVQDSEWQQLLGSSWTSSRPS